ncbi:type III secretion system export apparatus subunit SctU [Parachitinimonas caeni]|uniref:Type III secretion system export apparatus subunit SctU n=1 Tax=Parachitinimonas caeni TaxID=3031301 RepID=A0ABT7DUK6_9NEIS|nr:type III secretion system export apparatus subunit SctU [Parachitinimonas caeni]MDK2123504.1 type III secretion system export apparatus subunit SctU [Parachitinimonas caeni]
MSDKTEQPTSKKLRDARNKGQVAKSKDFTQTVLILAMFGYLLAAGPSIIRSMAEMIVLPSQLYGMPFRNALAVAMEKLMRDGITLLLPFILIVLVLGIFSEMVQTGVLFAFEAMKPSAKKLNVVENAKNMVSKKNLMEFVKNCLKVAFLSALIYVLVKNAIDPLVKIPPAGIAGIGLAVGSLLGKMLVYVAVAYLVIGVADLGWQRYQHIKGLMMSKEEVKQEYKEMEGDPHIKGKRKHLAQELAMGGMVEKTRKASVVVTNPTHIAVALFYDQEETPLPVVLAKGQDLVAERIVAIAKEEGIPIMQNIPLARALHATAELDQYIPSELIEPVAEVLRLVQQMAAERDH